MRRAASRPDPVAVTLLCGALALAFFAGRMSVSGESGPRQTPRSPATFAPEANPPADAPTVGSYRAIVTRIIDGDTVEARIPIWLGQEIITKVRLRGIDAPEIDGACGAERHRAEAARDRLAALIGGEPVTLTHIGPDKYSGRVVARVMTGAPDRLADAGALLVSEGLARRYSGKRRESWCQLAGN
jgi:endonuclease YncB( thermonuclease family)